MIYFLDQAEVGVDFLFSNLTNKHFHESVFFIMKNSKFRYIMCRGGAEGGLLGGHMVLFILVYSQLSSPSPGFVIYRSFIRGNIPDCTP